MATHDQGIPRRFRSYFVDDDPYGACKIWEVARATTAAPTYFEPIKISAGSKTETFVDGAMGCNNPTGQIMQEASRVFHLERRTGCIVNIGTGTRTIYAKNARGPRSWAGLVSVLKNHVTSGLSVDEGISHFLSSFPGSYIRFSVPDLAEDVSLGDWKKMDDMKARTREYLQQTAKEDIDKVADSLAKQKSQGLTVGHISTLDRTQIILDTHTARARGTSSRFFTGRRDILGRLYAIFDSRQRIAGTRTEALLVGMGGVGKTQIALRFAEMQEDKFDHVFWFDASNSATLEQSYGDLVYRAVGELVPASEAKTKAMHWLETTQDRWFIVFDNCDDRSLTPWLPNTVKGNILYTSRNRDLQQRLLRDCILDVDKLPEEDAMELLLKTSRLEIHSASEQDLAVAILEELGHLPLAIDQAGAYINMSNSDLEAYLILFRTAKDDMLRRPRYLGSDDSRNIPVYATFDISYKALHDYSMKKAKNPKAQDSRYALKVLSTLCFYHHERVSIDTFLSAAWNICDRDRSGTVQMDDDPLGELVKVDQQREWIDQPLMRGLELLRSFSLVLQNDHKTYFSMHPLVHSWARERMSARERKERGLGARTILFNSISYKDSNHATKLRAASFVHLKACQGHVEARYDECPRLESAWEEKVARVALQVNRPWDAVEARTNRVRILGYEYSLDSKKAIQATVDLAEAYLECGRYGEPEILLLGALERAQTLFPDDPDNVVIENWRLKLAGAYYDMGSIDLQLEQLHIVRDSMRRRLGPENPAHPSLVSIERQIENVPRVMEGGEVQSRPLAEEKAFYEAQLAAYGPSDWRTIRAKDDYAEALGENGQPKEAEDIFNELYPLYREKYGENHMKTIDLMVRLGGVVLDQGRSVEAEAIRRHALRYAEEELGPQHPTTLHYTHNAYATLFHQGRMQEVIPMLEKLQERIVAAVGPGHYLSRTNLTMLTLCREFLPHVTPAIQRRLRETAIAKSRDINPDFQLPELPPIVDREDDDETQPIEGWTNGTEMMKRVYREHGFTSLFRDSPRSSSP